MPIATPPSEPLFLSPLEEGMDGFEGKIYRVAARPHWVMKRFDKAGGFQNEREAYLRAREHPELAELLVEFRVVSHFLIGGRHISEDALLMLDALQSPGVIGECKAFCLERAPAHPSVRLLSDEARRQLLRELARLNSLLAQAGLSRDITVFYNARFEIIKIVDLGLAKGAGAGAGAGSPVF